MGELDERVQLAAVGRVAVLLRVGGRVEGDRRRGYPESDRIVRTERKQNARFADDVDDAKHRQSRAHLVGPHGIEGHDDDLAK